MTENKSDIIRKLKKTQKNRAIWIPLLFSPIIIVLIGVLLPGYDIYAIILITMLFIILFEAFLLFLCMIRNIRYEKMKQDLGVSNDDELNYYLGNSRKINGDKFINDNYLIDLPHAKLYRLADIKNAERYNKKYHVRHRTVHHYFIKIELANGKKGKLNFGVEELEREYAYILISKQTASDKGLYHTSIID